MNRAARPVPYRRSRGLRASTLPSRSMAFTGLVVLAFIVYHLLHFSVGAVSPQVHALVDAKGRHDVYGMVLASFQNPWIVASYVIAMILLGLHLVHAAQSLVQTLGIRYAYGNRTLKSVALSVVAAVTIGNLALPLLVCWGIVGPADATAPPGVSRELRQ